MVRTQIQLTEDQISVLRQMSAATGRSMASLIRESVDQMASRGEKDLGWERALEAVGCAASGRSDLSAEHDRHLAKAYAGDVR
jgi:hypothetical protein